MKTAVNVRPAIGQWPRRFSRPRSNEHGTIRKFVLFIAVVVLASIAISQRRHQVNKVESNPSETASSQSPFEEVVQQTEEARHGVPTGVPLNPKDEHFLTARDQIGLGIALLLAIVLANRRLAPGLGALLMKRFNPWTAVAAPPPIVEEQFVAEFATQLQIVERGDAEIARSRQEIVDEFIQTAPQKLKELRNLFAEMNRSQEPAARQKSLGDLHAEVIALKNRVGALELTPAWQLATGVERLIGQLAEKPANITPSTLRTVAGGLLLLNELCVPDVRKDLATNPPVRFLAVDDDPISRRAVSMCLKKVSQAPDIAEHGEAALELADRQAYDAVFLDVEMPGLDGFEVCTKMHQLENNRLTPVVFVTGHSDFESRAKSTSSGGQDLIAKPFLSAEITVKALTLLFRGRLDRQKAGAEASAKEALPAVATTPSAKQEAKKVAAVESKNGVSKVQAKANAPAAASDDTQLAEQKSPEPLTPNPQEYAKAFAVHGAEHLREMEGQIIALHEAKSAAARQEIFGEIYLGLNVVRSEAARAGLKTICELASGLGKLVSKLLEKPKLYTPSTLQAITAAIGLLEELARGAIEVDHGCPPVRVLVVDDEPLSRRAITNALQLAFGKPDSAENGESAVVLAQNKVFDVIFLDILMPEMDGFETCSKIRETRLNGTTPIIFVTSQKDNESRGKSIESGANGFISKPVLPAEIFLTALTFALRARMGKGASALPAEQLEAALC
jgi:CheY-like chemotaxis protein